MPRRHTTALLVLLGVFSYAQAVTCRKGIPCGNACISASYTCHVGPPVTPPSASPPAPTLTSPPIPTEPLGTYVGWTVADNGPALALFSERTTPVPVTPGYSKQLVGLTAQDARTRIERVLHDEFPAGVVLLRRAQGTAFQWLARQDDATRGVLIFADVLNEAVSLQVSAYSASSAFDLPGFTGTTLDAVLAQVAPPPVVLVAPPAPLPAPAADPGLGLTFDPETMFTDPATGALVVAAQCQPFSFTLQPARAFSSITLSQRVNEPLSYALDVTVDGKLRFTQQDALSSGPLIPVLVGQQAAGATVKFSYTPRLATVLCRGVLTVGFKVE